MEANEENMKAACFTTRKAPSAGDYKVTYTTLHRHVFHWTFTRFTHTVCCAVMEL